MVLVPSLLLFLNHKESLPPIEADADLVLLRHPSRSEDREPACHCPDTVKGSLNDGVLPYKFSVHEQFSRFSNGFSISISATSASQPFRKAPIAPR